MITQVLNTSISEGKALKFALETTTGQHNITGFYISTEAPLLEMSLYQDNRSRAVFSRKEFASTREVNLHGKTYAFKRKKGACPLQVRARGNRITGIIKGLKVNGTQPIKLYFLIDEWC